MQGNAFFNWCGQKITVQDSDFDREFRRRISLNRWEKAALVLRLTLKSLARGRPRMYFAMPASPMKPNTVARWLGRSARRRLFGERVLARFRIGVTHDCQCDCWHCYERPMGRWGKGKRCELDSKEIIGTINDAARLGATQFAFAGGEPLVKEGILDIVGAGSALGDTTIFTNGIVLSEMAHDLKKAGLRRVRVSIDSPDSAAHDAYRKYPGCFSKAVEGLRRASEEGLAASISTYVTRETLRNGKFREVLDLGREVGADALFIFPVIPSGKLEDFSQVLTLDELEELAMIMSEYNRDAPPLAYNPGWFMGKAHECIGLDSAYMSCYGDVTPCGFVPVSYGNVKKEPLAKIWGRLSSDEGLRHTPTPCPMCHESFRKRYIYPRPKGAPIPCPVELLVKK